MTKKLIFALVNFLTLGALARRRRRATVQRIQERTRALLDGATRQGRLVMGKAFHRATIWKALGAHPKARLLPRRVRRAAMFNAANHAHRLERGIEVEMLSRGHQRRMRRGYIDPALLLPTVKAGADETRSFTATADQEQPPMLAAA